jgi:hypothetical protein
VVFAVSLYRQAQRLVIFVFIGEFNFGITPRDSTVRQGNKRDFVLVGLFGVSGCLVC